MDRSDWLLGLGMIAVPILVGGVIAFFTSSVLYKMAALGFASLQAFCIYSEAGQHRSRAFGAIFIVALCVALTATVLPHVLYGKPWRWM